jgi:hypothetical protein
VQALDVEALLDEADANGMVAMLIIGPTMAVISDRFSTSEMMVALNPKESNYIQKSFKQPKLNCSSSTYCEMQESLEKYVCAPYPRCAYYQLMPSGLTLSNSIGKIFNVRQHQPWPEGLVSTHAKGFYIQFKRSVVPGGPRIHVTLAIIMPAATWPHIGHLYLANYSEQTKYFYWNNNIHLVLGEGNYGPAGNVEKIEVTMDDQSSNAPMFASNGGGFVTKTYVHGVGFISLQQYHNFVKMFAVMSNTQAKRDLTVTFAGADFGALGRYMTPFYGLNSLSVNIGSDGVSTTASWSSALPVAMKPDLFTSEIGPKIIQTV